MFSKWETVKLRSKAYMIAMNLFYLWSIFAIQRILKDNWLRLMGPILKEITEPYPYCCLPGCTGGM